jgi:hypothetical protein
VSLKHILKYVYVKLSSCLCNNSVEQHFHTLYSSDFLLI